MLTNTKFAQGKIKSNLARNIGIYTLFQYIKTTPDLPKGRQVEGVLTNLKIKIVFCVFVRDTSYDFFKHFFVIWIFSVFNPFAD